MTEVDPFEGMIETPEDTQVAPVEEEAGTSEIQLANFSNSTDFDSDDLLIPRIRLAQGLTAEVQDGEAKPGQWLMTGFEPKNTLTVVPLMFARNRTLREADAGAIICRSNDSKTGVGDPGGNCSVCPMNKWTDGENGQRIGPRCVFSYVYIGYVKEFDALGLLEFRRTSLQSGKMLNTMCSQRGIGNFNFQLVSSKEQSPRGTYYKINIKPMAIDKALLAKAHEMIAN